MDIEKVDESSSQLHTDTVEEASIQEISPAKKRWKRLSLFFKGVYLFNHLEATTVDNINSMLDGLSGLDESSSSLSPGTAALKFRGRSMSSCAIDEHRMFERFFQHIVRGGRDDQREIEQLILSDPKRYILSSEQTEQAMVNRRDSFGNTPLYLAAKHGHSDVVQLLLDYKASPQLLVRIGKKDFESALDVACRWHHTNVVYMLLNAGNWAMKDLKRAKKLTRSREIVDLIVQKMRSRRGRSCCRCSK